MASDTTPDITPDAARARLTAYRAIAAVVAVTVTAATAYTSVRAPWLASVLAVVEAAVLYGIGKALGVPIAAVTDIAMTALVRDRPAHAEQIAVRSLASLPPDRSVAATQSLFASLPPHARARASINPPAGHPADAPTTIQFVGLDAELDGVPRDPAGTPIRPSSIPPTVDEPTHPTRPRPSARRVR